MRLGIIADDFTGASDVANTLASSGVRTVMLFTVDAKDVDETFDACVVALKTRSIAAEDAAAQSLQALARLQALGCTRFFFKICSTFDSTPRGNIGPVGEALAETLGMSAPVPTCPAFPAAGRTVFQGHLFVGDKLLSESGMERHPLNPMTDPDLRRWLALQTSLPVGHVSLSAIRSGKAQASLAREAERGCRFVIADAVDNDDLFRVGAAIVDGPLAIGGSGLALGLAPFYVRASQVVTGSEPAQGPAAILSGSCSAATRGQVEAYRRAHPSLSIDIDALMCGDIGIEDIAAFVLANAGQAPLVYSSADPEEVTAAQGVHGREPIAGRLDDFFGELAVRLVDAGFGRVVIAGGETSGAVVSALKLGAVEVGREIATGVPLLRSTSRDLALVLKSGNFGGVSFFEDALSAMESS